MVSFTGPFGSQATQPTNVSYAGYTFSSDLQLEWPAGLQDTNYPAALAVDLNPTAAGLHVLMPPATQVSVGRAALFYNVSANSVEIRASDGSSLTTIASGVAKYVFLIGNSTDAGNWRIYTLGAGTSGADASALAGAGLQAISNQLNWAPSTLVLNSNQTLNTGYRATVIVWQGGAGTITLPLASDAGDRWSVAIVNNGSGTVAVDGNGSLIDGSSSQSYLPGESSFIFNVGGTQWNKVGYGRSVAFTVTTLSKSIAGTGTTTLSAVEAAAQIQSFTGILTGNSSVVYGTASNFYFVENATTGAFSVTFKGSALDVGVVVTQGTRAILVNTNGVMSLAQTLSSGTVTSVATGTGLTGGPITSTGTISIAATGVVAGTYGGVSSIPVLAVNAQGQVTAASNTALGAVPVGGSMGWPGIDPPAGWLFEDGTAYSRVTYAALFAALTSASTGTPTSGNAVLTSVAKNYVGLGVEGAKIEGTNIPVGTTIVSVTSNTITMSANATGSPGSVAIRVFPYGNGDGSTTFNVRDKRGRVGVGRDNMGGSAAGRVTNAGSGIVGTSLSATGGEQAHVLTIAELAAHGHGVTDPGHSHSFSNYSNASNITGPPGGVAGGALIGGFGTDAALTGISIQNTGSNTAHNTMQPTLIENSIVYAGV